MIHIHHLEKALIWEPFFVLKKDISECIQSHACTIFGYGSWLELCLVSRRKRPSQGTLSRKQEGPKL